MKKTVLISGCSLIAIALAGPANAADFGGDCCADLEERIAELEATTARKGNRKVSLTVSGFVSEAVMYWNDGEESNTYVVTNDSGRGRIRFRGSAKISKDWEAGYRLELGFRAARSDRVDQGGIDSRGRALNADDPGGDKIDIRYAAWYIKSKTFGEVHVGETEVAAQSVTQSMLTQNKDIANLADVEDQAAGFKLRVKGLDGPASLSNREWRRLVKDNFEQPGEGNRGAVVWYKSPKFAGFQFQAAWGEDDYWDVGLRYANTLGNFKVKAAIAYGEDSDGGDNAVIDCLVKGPGNGNDADCQHFGGSIAVMHVPTGLFVQAGAGWFEDDNIDARFNDVAADEESTFWSIQAGIETKWFAIGKTTLYGEYFKHEGGANDRDFAGNDAISIATGFAGNTTRIWDSEVEMFGVGLVQGIDAAAMRMYLFYRHYEADLTVRDDVSLGLGSAQLEDLDVITGGALIEF